MKMRLDAWERRPTEEANLFNPAFLGSLVYEFVKSYSGDQNQTAPFTLPLVGLCISLHRPTRLRLPSSTVTSLYEWLQRNEDVLIGFAERTQFMSPYYREAIQFSMNHQTLRFAKNHAIGLGVKKANFVQSFLSQTTPEFAETVRQMRFVARWFLKSGSETSILAAWGVKP